MDASRLLWWYLNVLTKERYEAVLQVFSSLEEAAGHLNEEFFRGLGCREETARELMLRLEEFEPGRMAQVLEERGIQVACIDDPSYPRLLADVADPPVFLSWKGDLSLLEQPCIGMVGTRAMTPYGRRVVQDLAPEFVAAGMVTVSGLAAGVDAVVAEATLGAGGRTVAVLGHGLGQIYPKSNERLALRILEAGGLLLSEYPPGMEPGKYTFPARNRIIAALSLGTLVVEAPEESGALITAEIALGYGRPVFAVPGSVYDPASAGSNALIAKGAARLISSAADVLRELGIVSSAAADTASVPAYEPATPEEAAVLASLTTLPQHTDDLVEKSGLPAAGVGTALTMLELSGAVRNLGGGMWVRI